MANLTIFGLTQLSSGDVDIEFDLTPVWDNSASETKKMTLLDFKTLMQSGITPYSLDVQDDGSSVFSTPSAINFVGSAVTVTQDPAGVAKVEFADTSILSINTQTAPYTLVLTDASKLVRMNVVSATNLTIPPNSSVAFVVGTVLYVEQMGAGTITILAGSGVTINTTAVKTPYQYGTLTLIQVSANVWNVLGGTV